jgi:CRP-like cAMP-binding protein
LRDWAQPKRGVEGVCYANASRYFDLATDSRRWRVAEAVAVRPSELLALNWADFNRLREAHPDAAIALLLALGRLQSRTLRWSAREIQRLIQW